MPNLYDNVRPETRLGPALRESFADFASVDIATGYLDLRGWDSFADLIGDHPDEPCDAPRARVLVGMVAPSDAQELLERLQHEVQPPAFGSDVHDLEKALSRRDQLVKHLRNQLMRGLATERGQNTLRALKRQLESGAVEMKVFTERPLHGKTYIFTDHSKKHGSRWSYVGSSNLTGAGLASNLELNIDVQDSDANEKLARWFDERWNDPFSLPISAEIIDLIASSWADPSQPTPFELYLKVCYSLSQDARDGMGYVLPTSMQKILLDYQESAVRTLSRRIVRRGGTMLGDVVGLGKTLTAVATSLMLEAAEDYSTLVLCPKNLEKMWVEHVERFDMPARVIPYSMTDKILPELKRFNLVICDESHNLRNSGTQVYETIHKYIRDNGAKVLLLTATPYNLAFQDVANQIALYINDDDDLGITPTAALRKDPQLTDKVDGKINTLAAFRRSEEAEDWRRLMSDHLVRRTRSFIKRTAVPESVTLPDGQQVERQYLRFRDGTKYFFPTRVPQPLSHEFTASDPARHMEDDETLDAVRSLLLPRYRLAEYDNPRAKHADVDKKILDDIRSGRGNVSGFVRVGLFKRLSSSGYSFTLSLQRQRARNELFIYAIDAGLKLPLGSFTDTQFHITDDDLDRAAESGEGLAGRYDDLVRRLPAKTKWVQSTVFRSSLRKDLIRDNETIAKLLRRFGTWEAARDSKVVALVDLLRRRHAGEKVLVFTEYADTAEYIGSVLRGADVGRAEVVTGRTSDPSEVVRRFSPLSNRLPGEREAEMTSFADSPVDVLIATDVLSEGQNLQDSHIVVNYDLPWAIIRIIQRAGRVDRIGQTSDKVYVYLISHEKVEQAINLRQRIKDRLGNSAEAFGSDEQFFGSNREVQILDDFYNGRVPNDIEDTDVDGEADAVSEAWLTWSNAQEEHPDIVRRVLRMQDLAHSTRQKWLHETQGGVTCYVSTASGVDAFATSADDDGAGRLLTPLEALRIFRCEIGTPTAEPRLDHFTRQASLVQGPLATEMVAQGNLKGIRKWAWSRLGGHSLFAERADEALNALHERPLTEHASHRLTQARRNRYSLDDLADLLNQLHSEDRLVIRTADSDSIQIVCSLGVLD